MPIGENFQVEVCKPNTNDRAVIKHLFVFYRYDLMPFVTDGLGSEVNLWGVLGSDGQTTHEATVDDLDIWWTKPDILMPLLIRAAGMPAGLMMVAKPPHAHPSMNYRVEDFFILNRWRRAGVGLSAATEVFNRYPGRWELGWLPKNVGAEKFWRSVTTRLQLKTEDWEVAQEANIPGIPGLRLSAGRL